jgi:hypothetical protein
LGELLSEKVMKTIPLQRRTISQRNGRVKLYRSHQHELERTPSRGGNRRAGLA